MIRQVAEHPCPINQKEFLSEPDPAKRKAHATLLRDIALQPLLCRTPVRSGRTINIRRAREHHYPAPSRRSPMRLCGPALSSIAVVACNDNPELGATPASREHRLDPAGALI